MASSVTVKTNFPPLTDVELTNRDVMREVGLLVRERVYRRTVGGQDENEQSFAPYSKGYAKRKAQEVGLYGVNLQLSGAMLNAIVITELKDDSVTLGFSG